jgi:hypothetical protein
MQKKILSLCAPAVLVIVAAFASGGCYGERHLVMTPNPDSINEAPLPLSVRVEVERFTLNVDPLMPVDLDFRDALLSYMNKRRTFREISGQAPEAVFRVKAKLSMLVGHGTRFIYQFAVSATLLTNDKVSIGSYEVEEEAIGGATRFTASADEPPTNLAFNRALDSLFAKVETDRAVILARLQGPPPVVASPAVPRVPASDVDTVPSVAARLRRSAYAVLIGIEQYQQQLPRADFAAHDARIMGQYLSKSLGYAEEHVVVLLNDRATKNGVEKYIEGWLPDHVESGDSVFVYFSGHGAPNVRTGKAYLVPYDGDPAFVEQTGYPLDRLYDRLAALPAKEVIVMLDSCFSGAGGRSVLGKGMRPMVLSVENPLLAKGKVVVLAASGRDQVSSTYTQQSHGLLTYFFLKGLQGEAGATKDGRIELRDLYEYLKPQVERTARREFHNEQSPQLLGNPDLLSRGIVLRGAGKP